MIFYLVFCILLISFVSSFIRMDYNLPLFIFYIIVWNKIKKLRNFCFFLIFFSLIIDIIYISFWERLIKLKEIQNIDKGKPSNLLLFYNIINILNIATIIIKCIIILYLIIKENNIRKAINIKYMKNELLNLFLVN